MQNKGAIKIFAIILGLACIFYLSFTWITRSVEADAMAYADAVAVYLMNELVFEKPSSSVFKTLVPLLPIKRNCGSSTRLAPVPTMAKE